MKLRSKTKKQKVNNRKIQREREREQKQCGFEICSTTFLSNNPDIKPNKKNKKQNRIEQNMKLKLTDNCVELEDGGRSDFSPHLIRFLCVSRSQKLSILYICLSSRFLFNIEKQSIGFRVQKSFNIEKQSIGIRVQKSFIIIIILILC